MRRLLALILVTLATISLFPGWLIMAQSKPLQYPEAISLNVDAAGKTASGVFVVTAVDADATALQFSPAPLADPEGNLAVTAEAITVSPSQVAQLAAGTSQTVTVALESLPAPGSYAGTISIAYAEQPSEATDAVAVTLIVEAPEEEALDIGAEEPAAVSESPKLRVEPEGQPAALYLTSDGQNYRVSIAVTSLITEVSGVKLTNISNLDPAEGGVRSISAGEVTINPTTPQTLAQGETKGFDVTFPKPSKLGTYRGSLEVTYDDKPATENYEIQLMLEASLPVVTVTPADHILELGQEEKNGPYKATFNLAVDEGHVSELVFTTNGLERADGPGRISPDKVTFDPTTASIGPNDPPKPVTVSATAPEAGKYEGVLVVSYFGTAADEAQGSVTLTLKTQAAHQATLALEEEGGVKFSSYVGERVTQTVRLKETGDLNDVRTITATRERLKDKDNQLNSIPAEVLGLTGQVDVGITRGDTGEIYLPFDFDVPGTRAGTFGGNLLVASDNAPDLNIPIEVTLKHPLWPRPLGVIAVGIILGLFLNWYQSERREEDELRLTIQRLRDHLKSLKDGTEARSDPANATEPTGKLFYEFYGESATQKLDRAKEMLELDMPNALTEAKALVEQVQACWPRWLQHGIKLYSEMTRTQALINRAAAPNLSSVCAKKIHDKLYEIKAKRDTYTTDTEMTQAIDPEATNLDALADAFFLYRYLHDCLETLKREKEFENDAAHAFQVRADKQDEILKEADQAQVQAVRAELDKIEKEMQSAYENWPHFYADDKAGCKAKAEQFVQEIDSLVQGESHPHWANVKVRIQNALEQANQDKTNGIRFERASRLVHNAWRAAWFYLNVSIPIRKRMANEDINKEPWKAIAASLQEIETWMVTTDYGGKKLDEFDQYLLTEKRGPLYQKLEQAGEPGLPPPYPLRPDRPYRHLDDLGIPRQVSSLGKGTPSQMPDEKEFSLPAYRWARKFKEWLATRWHAAERALSSPRTRLFTWRALINVLSVILLSAIGLKTWQDDATFGASIFDYLTLFIWGFGGQATKESVVQIITGWGVKSKIQ